jgi:thiol-disulfide isomerase/thioredoxin
MYTLLRMRLLILLAFLPLLISAQSISVQPDRFLPNRAPGVAPVAVFSIDKNDTTLFGAGNQPKFVLPTSKGENGFVFVYCPSCPPEYTNDQRVLVYFTDIGQPGMRAYVDRNYNHDYTDDEGFVSADSAGRVLIELVSAGKPSSSIFIRYTLLSKGADISRLPVQYFENNPYYAGVKLIDKNYWLAAEQLCLKAKDAVIGKDSICVTFFDQNLDGCFTGVEDMMGLFPYGIDSTYNTKYRGMRMIVPGLVLGFNGHPYEVKCDTNNCNPITLTLRPDLAPPVALSVGDQLPHFFVQFFDGDSADIYTKMQPGKYTYIEFWGMWCTGCRMAIPGMKSMNDTLSDRLTIISLDSYDNRQRVKDFVKENEMKWTQGYSNSDIEKLLYADDGFPYGILVDPAGKIVSFDVSPGRVAGMVLGRK